MNLVFVIKCLNNASGGAERVLCAICSELVLRGHFVTIITFDPPCSKPFYRLHQNIKLHHMNIGNSSGSANLLDSISRIYTLRRVIVSLKPDVVVGFMHSSFVLLSLALLGLKIPLIGSEHNPYKNYHNTPIQYLLVLISSFFLKRITVVSKSEKSFYPQVLRSRMIVINNPLEPAQSYSNPGSFKSQYTILSVGRLEPIKDYSTLISAFAQLSSSFPDWRLKIFGTGSMHSELTKLISTFNLSAKCFLSGTTQNLAFEYSSADLFVSSARHESYGLAVAEALTHGLPVVAFSDSPALVDLIFHQKNGLLVDPSFSRITSLSRGLEYLMSNPDLRSQLGQAARSSVQLCSISSVVDSWLHLFETYV